METSKELRKDKPIKLHSSKTFSRVGPKSERDLRYTTHELRSGGKRCMEVQDEYRKGNVWTLIEIEH